MSKTRSLHHIVFATKSREMAIPEAHKRKLYNYIYGIITKNRCYLHRLNGIPNHIHMLVDIHPSVCIADLVRDIKVASGKWMRENPDFPMFRYWGEGYYAVSIGVNELEECRNYIIAQEEHHMGRDFMAEMEWFAFKSGLRWFQDDWD